MTNDMEALARALMNSKQGAKISHGMEKLSALSGTEEGAKLMELLGGNSEAVKNAAQAALSGDKDAAKAVLMQLFSTKEGAALAAKLMELLGQ